MLTCLDLNSLSHNGTNSMISWNVCTEMTLVLFTHVLVSSLLLQVALAVSLNLRTYLRLKATNTGKVCVNLPNIDRFLCWDVSELKRVMPFCSGN